MSLHFYVISILSLQRPKNQTFPSAIKEGLFNLEIWSTNTQKRENGVRENRKAQKRVSAFE
jgi:hypothetical protein